MMMMTTTMNVFFGEDRRSKACPCPFGHDKLGEFIPHLSGAILRRK